MSVLIEFCFIHVVGGYVNVAQIVSVGSDNTILTTNSLVDKIPTGDSSPEAFLKRVMNTCGGKRE